MARAKEPAGHDPDEGERIGVWGASGSGKSSWVKRRIAGLTRLVVFDPQDEYGGRNLVSFRPYEADQLSSHIRDHWADFRAAYVPPAGREAEALSKLCWYLVELQDWHKAKGKPFPKITLVAEELNLAFPTHGATLCTGFAEVCSRGRKRHIEVIGVSQRVAEVATRFRDNLTEHVVFRQADETGSQKVASNARLPWRDVLDLPPLEYFHVKGMQKDRQKIAFR